jgi:hypothetical protein
MRCHHHSTSSPSSNSLTYLMTTKAVAECERGSPRQGGTVGTPIRSRGCRPPEVPACCERCHARYGWGWHTLWGTAMRKGNWAINVAASLGWLAFVLVIIGLNGPAIAQGGANCLFQCDSQCYGQQGPYCRSGCMARCNSNQNFRTEHAPHCQLRCHRSHVNNWRFLWLLIRPVLTGGGGAGGFGQLQSPGRRG